MADIKIAGILRASAFSPNHIGNDAAILNNVAEQLRKRGCEVSIYSEEQLLAGEVDEHIILNMCREMRSILALQKREDAGDLVINSGYGIENCIRERMARILMGSNIPYPDSIIVSTDEGVRDALLEAKIDRCWIKRADSHTMHKEDVTCVRHAEEAQEVLQEYFLRGIKRAVISRHFEGAPVKFYGILGTPFFYWFFPHDSERNKGNDDFEKNLRAICSKAAETLDVKIYGGECAVAENGDIRIIDFNDWPSFAPCRAEGATQIAKYVIGAIKEHFAG